MPDRPKFLLIGAPEETIESLPQSVRDGFDVVTAASLQEGLVQVPLGDVQGVWITNPSVAVPSVLLQGAAVLESFPDGLAILDGNLKIQWCNERLSAMIGPDAAPTGCQFYEALGDPEILGPDFCPFHTALGTREPASSTIRVGEKRYFEVYAAPLTVRGSASAPKLIAVTVRDTSSEVLYRQKLQAIHEAGLELGDLSAEELLEMTVSDRIELLKQKIVQSTQDVLEYETVEIRLTDRSSGKLEPLLVVGMSDDAATRKLRAAPEGNGVTGFVAVTGKSYLCEDTSNDPLYLPGAPNARSSLTVPLVLHDVVLGTFNVESTRPGAFDENDLQFLELFAREVAVALNTLELLVAEKMTTAHASTDLLMREVARPVDEILNDTAWILERYIGHDPNVCERLQRILKRARDIKQVIHTVGEEMAPQGEYCPLPPRPQRPKLRRKRILVVDSDESVRQAAHELLGRYGCEVETAHDGEESLLMSRSFHYDAVLADIRLPDMDGFECFSQLRGLHEHLPVILMTGFGYDPSHSIVKARQMGCKSVLYKPFRLDQLLKEVENAVSAPGDENGDTTTPAG